MTNHDKTLTNVVRVVEVMRPENTGDTAGTKSLDVSKNCIRLAYIVGTCRFIKKQPVTLEADGSGERNGLALASRQFTHEPIRIDVRTDVDPA